MDKAVICCAERGKPLEVKRAGKLFCSTPCRQSFNNRRMQRGAELYDLFRAMRRERDKARELGLWAEICRLEKAWNDEDAGRKTWVGPERALAHLRDKGSIPRGQVIVSARRA